MNRVLHDEFEAMGSSVELTVVADDVALLDVARALAAHLEQRWSRFLPDSDISRINMADGAPTTVHPDTITLFTAMVSGVRATDGAFDPTMLAAVVAAGYATSRVDPQHTTVLPAAPRMRTDFHDVRIDADACTVTAPAGACFDAGGVGKGLAADLVASALLEHGARGALVSVGGDVRVVGEAPQDGGWAIGLGDALDPSRETALLRLVDGGVATSGTARRRWFAADGTARHHLLDPSTLRSIDTVGAAGPVGPGGPGELAEVTELTEVTEVTELVEVTVVAGTAGWAEMFTKAVFVLGAGEGLARLERLGLPARAVFADGTSWATPQWRTVAVATTHDSATPPVGGGDGVEDHDALLERSIR